VEQEVATTLQEATAVYNDSADWVGDRVEDFKGLWP
jgi:hypothetical protein